MSGLLCVETATDACSLALEVDGSIDALHEVVPRRHNQRIFEMLDELADGRALADLQLGAIAFGSGPGSFTGLRVAASFAQGLAYSMNLPVVAVPTLAVLAQTAFAEGVLSPDEATLVTIDARINEVYAAVYSVTGGMARLADGPWVCAPAALPDVSGHARSVIGSGCRYAASFPTWLTGALDRAQPDITPRAQAMLCLAREKLACGDVLEAHEVQPSYVQEEIRWKKLSEQVAQQ